ncbi:hypothetical protein EG68_09693, partial [Paragonimus skrjabini miyazakii]
VTLSTVSPTVILLSVYALVGRISSYKTAYCQRQTSEASQYFQNRFCEQSSGW